MNDVLRANTHKGEIMNLYNWPLLLTAIFLGMGLGIQAPINAWIGKRFGKPLLGCKFLDFHQFGGDPSVCGGHGPKSSQP